MRVNILRAATLLCGAALLGILGGCARKPAMGIFVDPAFGPLIAPDTKLLAGVRLDKVRETPVYKKLDKQFDLDRRLDLFSRRTGLDPRKDLWQVLVASNGQNFLVMARGKFTTGFVPGSSKKLDAHTAWCVKSVTFSKGNGSGTLKVFLVNDAFDVSPYGWAEVQQPEGFGGSDTYKWDFSIGLPQGYDNIPPNTEVQFQTTNHASGNVFITYVVVRVP